MKCFDRLKFLEDWYNESYDYDYKIPLHALKGSKIEIILFYVSLSLVFFFIGKVLWCTNAFHWRYLVLFIPALIWMFLRSSRKDMSATANWVAGFLGAIGGATLVLLKKYLPIP